MHGIELSSGADLAANDRIRRGAGQRQQHEVAFDPFAHDDVERVRTDAMALHDIVFAHAGHAAEEIVVEVIELADRAFVRRCEDPRKSPATAFRQSRRSVRRADARVRHRRRESGSDTDSP